MAALRYRLALAAFLVAVTIPSLTAFGLAVDWRVHTSCHQGIREGGVVCAGHGVRSPVAGSSRDPGDPTGPDVSPFRVGRVVRTAAAPGASLLPDGAPPLMRSATGAMGWLAIMWTAGLVAAAGSLFHGLSSLRRLWREAVPVTDAAVRSALSDSLAAMGGRFPVEVRATTDIISPAAMWGRPLRILLPVTLERALNPVELRAVFAHELAHLRGQDPWAGLMQAAGCSLFFFNPFVLALSKAVDREREALRDAEAAEGIGSRRRYGETLLALAGFQSCVAHVGTHRLVGEGDLAGRIRRLVAPTSETRRAGIRATAMGTIWVLIVTVVIGATATVGTLSSWAVMVDHAEAAALPSSSSTH